MNDTPWIVADSSASALTAQLGEEWDALAELGGPLTDAEWAAPTPCPGWTVAAQYAHVIGTESMLLGRSAPDVDPGEPAHVRNRVGSGNEVWVAALRSLPRREVLERFAEVTARRREALSAMGEGEFSAPSWTPIGEADYRRFMQLRVFDCWVHEQDVRDAVGRPGHEAGPVAEQSIDEIFRSIGFIVGKRAGAPEGSTLCLRLTGPVHREVFVAVKDGRAGPLVAFGGDPTDTVSLTSSAFTRLACGRVDPEAVLDGALGGVTFGAELGLKVVTHLAYTM
jgi:uncharacterized protein (TIGR03083 family)